MKKPLLHHYKIIYSLSSIFEGEELNVLTVFPNATTYVFPTISAELVAFKIFNPHIGLKESTAEICSLFRLSSICETRKPQFTCALNIVIKLASLLELKQRQHLGDICRRSLGLFFLPNEYDYFNRKLPIWKPQEEFFSPSALPLISHTSTAHSFRASSRIVSYPPIFMGWCRLLIYWTWGYWAVPNNFTKAYVSE